MLLAADAGRGSSAPRRAPWSCRPWARAMPTAMRRRRRASAALAPGAAAAPARRRCRRARGRRAALAGSARRAASAAVRGAPERPSRSAAGRGRAARRGRRLGAVGDHRPAGARDLHALDVVDDLGRRAAVEVEDAEAVLGLLRLGLLGFLGRVDVLLGRDVGEHHEAPAGGELRRAAARLAPLAPGRIEVAHDQGRVAVLRGQRVGQPAPVVRPCAACGSRSSRRRPCSRAERARRRRRPGAATPKRAARTRARRRTSGGRGPSRVGTSATTRIPALRCPRTRRSARARAPRAGRARSSL